MTLLLLVALRPGTLSWANAPGVPAGYLTPRATCALITMRPAVARRVAKKVPGDIVEAGDEQ